jgi:phage shock protein C
MIKKNRYKAKLFGVCSGLADYFNTDDTLVRLIFVLGTLFTGGAVILLYLLLALMLPSD